MPTVSDIRRNNSSEPITMLTAYDAPTAAIIDDVGIDMILVGDSMGNTVMGYESTLPVTLEEMASYTSAVARATDETLVIADMPFLSFGVEESETLRNAGRMLKEANADAVKLESGPHTVDVTERLTDIGIPVMAHLGLTPQHINELGDFSRQATSEETARQMLEVAQAHQKAGAFSVVLEHVPSNVASEVTDALDIPTIGIGAGMETDGQVLVITDVLGLSERSPPFAKQFGNVREEMVSAVTEFKQEVQSNEFPADEHSHVEEDLDELY